MVKCSDDRLDELFGALGEPVRRSVVRTLASGERSVSELAAPYDMTMAAVIKHIAVLEKCGLVRTEKRGRIRYCRIDTNGLTIAQQWLTDTATFWTKRLEALTKFVEEDFES